ncbi:hypothetical protein KSP40_PGU006294 [Platanthera guangdongensis]|uniref:Uncharacterized protein n=1 Tax=Platanthera guangdongensis TaxID=2320717 RepID=A0ABR2MF05_9ASPA
MRERENKVEEVGVGAGSSSSCKKSVRSSTMKVFSFVGYGEKLKDVEQGPLIEWDPEGKSVVLNTALPSWKESDIITSHAFVVGSVLYEQQGLSEMEHVHLGHLLFIDAQDSLKSVVLNHCTDFEFTTRSTKLIHKRNISNTFKTTRSAIQCLKRKRLYEQQVEQLGNFQLRIHDQIVSEKKKRHDLNLSDHYKK